MSISKTILIGFAVGAGMSIPGISGGTMAILFGVYYKLLYCVDNILKDIKRHGIFLAQFSIGTLLGFFTAAKIITLLLSGPAEVPLRYAFLGAAAAAIVPVMRSAKALPLKLGKLLLIVAGIITAWAITLLPKLSLSGGSAIGLVWQLFGGILLAAALVLPGISGSQMLVTLGLYEQVMNNVAQGEFLSLLPLATGCLAGILLTAKLLSRLLERFDGTYLVILGFMLFSLTELIPQHSTPTELIIGLLCAAIGYVIVSLLISAELDKTNSAIL